MAANNGGGRQNSNMNEHVEFSVKAEEDLYLTGNENTIRRVTAETNYSCLMLKTQRFSSLFRHYAKYHGLRKDDLEYYFVNILENEDTPESVQLQRGDTIMVRKRRKPEPPEVAADDDTFYKDMKELLDDEEHMDAIFLVHKRSSSQEISSSKNRKMIGSNGPKSSEPPDTTIPTDLIEIKAHKSVLTARCQYFKAFFRTIAASNNSGSKSSKTTTSTMSSYNPFPSASNFRVKSDTSDSNPTPFAATSTTNATQIPVLAFKEAGECVVHVDSAFKEQHVRVALEFIYTNRITKIRDISTNDLLSLLHLSDMWLLRDMTRLVEHELIRNHMSTSTIVQMYGATEQLSAKRLSHACVLFIMNNLRHLAGNTVFMEEMQHYPLLCIPVLKAAAELLADGPLNKKQRTALSLSASAVGNTGEHHGSSQHNHHSSGGTPSGTNNHSNNNNNINIAAALRSSPVPDSDT